MVMEFTFGKMEIVTKVNGLLASDMAMEQTFSKMETPT